MIPVNSSLKAPWHPVRAIDVIDTRVTFGMRDGWRVRPAFKRTWMATTDTPRPPRQSAPARPAGAAAEDATAPERVPPEAEDFAHTLRRIAARRNAERAARPGLYR